MEKSEYLVVGNDKIEHFQLENEPVEAVGKFKCLRVILN
jgi:hypothetical protein